MREKTGKPRENPGKFLRFFDSTSYGDSARYIFPLKSFAKSTDDIRNKPRLQETRRNERKRLKDRIEGKENSVAEENRKR